MMRADNNSTDGPPYRRSGVCAYICLILWLILFAAGTTQTARGQATAGEYQVKAAFLFHFAQLVDWPEGLSMLRIVFLTSVFSTTTRTVRSSAAR